MTTTALVTVNPGAASRARALKPKQIAYAVIGIVILVVMLFPVYWMINASLQPSGNTLTAGIFPTNPSWAGYEKAFADQGKNLVTSLVISIGAVIVCLAIAAPAAYALAQFRYRWISIALLIILIGQMIPGIVIANALYAAYNDLGLLNTHVGLIIADASQSIPFAIIVMRAFMANIHPSIIEAARVDGAGQVRTFWSIALPVSKNALITAGLFAFLFAWSDFLFALTLTTTSDIRPVTLGIYQYLGTQVSNWSAVMATAVLSSLPAIILLLIAQKYIAAGAMGGSVK
ncbi:ABC transporter permease [Microbacterium sorbitolivorans]|uniref:Carbohydrate ABC transporter permease n=1 Tax=Microbacterium sorbitolivorans TaxID=1867410 RepID=A0A367XZ37_9MICO|nr:carbohydrate ABC transporter permease [Microbacterium sorbitolivorans]GGF38409.1 ABC transporter permease [Microbacterium sorbitolivorans]